MKPKVGETWIRDPLPENPKWWSGKTRRTCVVVFLGNDQALVIDEQGTFNVLEMATTPKGKNWVLL